MHIDIDIDGCTRPSSASLSRHCDASAVGASVSAATARAASAARDASELALASIMPGQHKKKYRRGLARYIGWRWRLRSKGIIPAGVS